MVNRTTSGLAEPIETLFHGEDVMRFHELVRQVPIARDVIEYAVRLASASRPGREGVPDFINEWVSWGAGLRAAQFLVLGGKARALTQGRYHVNVEDIQALAYPVLRHRILRNFRAESEHVGPDRVVDELLAAIPEPRSGL